MVARRYSILLRTSLVCLFCLFYAAYLLFLIQSHTAPIDYLTFMDIGHSLNNGTAVYRENSYYPMPYVMVFAFFDWLPRDLSIAVWLSLPVLCALLITNFSPFTLLYAPLISHFLGGQSALFGMLGFWGYRKWNSEDDFTGGAWLAVTTLKPQLAIALCAWACFQWLKYYQAHKRIPKQAWGFVLAVLVLYLPGFLIFPDWLSQWLSHLRHIEPRALVGLIPRLLIIYFPPGSPWFWFFLFTGTIGLFTALFMYTRRKLTLDSFMLFSFVISPLVHEYDLIQAVPILKTTKSQILAIILSIPGWIVIFTQYASDTAWIVFTIIAPGLLLYSAYQERKTTPTAESQLLPT